MVDINEYTCEVICEYKGELYSVRDNGAIMRHVREGKKARKLDNVWTFGNKDKEKGYMMISSHRVHIIVAKAFIPGNEDGKMVVDHIDTNRCNNRVENLRWLTRLENVLLNEATLKKVTFLCGGDINKFIENPSCLQDLTGDNQNIMWMRTVTPEEAKKAWERISEWAKRPCSTFKMMKQREETKDFEEWLKIHEVKDGYPSYPKSNMWNGKYDTNESKEFEKSNNHETLDFSHLKYSHEPKELIKRENIEQKEKNDFAGEIRESMTNGALQINFILKMKFPLCPKDTKGGLDSYANKLSIDEIIAVDENGGEYTIGSLGWTSDWKALQVRLKKNEKQLYQYLHIKCEEGNYIHSLGRYEKEYQFCDSPYVLQCGASTKCFFPLCPTNGNISLDEYAAILKKDELIEKNRYSDVYVIDREITHAKDGKKMIYVGVSMPDSVNRFGDLAVYIENGKVIHQIGSTFFDERSLERNFCKIRGQEWDDSIEVFDDYC